MELRNPSFSPQALSEQRVWSSHLAVALQVVQGEVEVSVGVGPIHDDRNLVPTGHLHYLPDGEDLPGDVDHVTHQDEAGAVSDLRFESLDDLSQVLRWNGDRKGS